MSIYENDSVPENNMVVEISEVGVATARMLGCYTVALIAKPEGSELVTPMVWGADRMFTDYISLNRFILNMLPNSRAIDS